MLIKYYNSSIDKKTNQEVQRLLHNDFEIVRTIINNTQSLTQAKLGNIRNGVEERRLIYYLEEALNSMYNIIRYTDAFNKTNTQMTESTLILQRAEIARNNIIINSAICMLSEKRFDMSPLTNIIFFINSCIYGYDLENRK